MDPNFIFFATGVLCTLLIGSSIALDFYINKYLANRGFRRHVHIAKIIIWLFCVLVGVIASVSNLSSGSYIVLLTNGVTYLLHVIADKLASKMTTKNAQGMILGFERGMSQVISTKRGMRINGHANIPAARER